MERRGDTLLLFWESFEVHMSSHVEYQKATLFVVFQRRRDLAATNNN